MSEIIYPVDRLLANPKVFFAIAAHFGGPDHSQLKDLFYELLEADILAAEAGDILPALLKPQPSNPRARQARDMIARWNRFMLADRPEPLIYAAWLMELQRGLFQARVGDDKHRLRGALQRAAQQVLHQLQLALAAGVAGVDQADDVLALDQPGEQAQAFGGLVDRVEREARRDHRQVGEAPLAALDLIFFRGN